VSLFCPCSSSSQPQFQSESPAHDLCRDVDGEGDAEEDQAEAKSALKCGLPITASPISAAMVEVMGLTGSKSDFGRQRRLLPP